MVVDGIRRRGAVLDSVQHDAPAAVAQGDGTISSDKGVEVVFVAPCEQQGCIQAARCALGDTQPLSQRPLARSGCGSPQCK